MGQKNRKRSPAAPSPSAVGAVHAVSAPQATLGGLRIVALDAAMAVERAAPTAEAAGHALQPAKSLFKSRQILYKDRVLRFHQPNS